MKKKIEAMFADAKAAVSNNPVELLLSVLFCLFGCFYNEQEDKLLEGVILYFPVFFLAANFLNLHTKGKKPYRFLYYLSALAFLPFLRVGVLSFSPTLFVSLLVIQLLYLIGGWQKDNDGFVRLGVRYLMAVFSALFLVTAAWLLSMSVYQSIRYVFDIWLEGESDFFKCLASILYLGVAPLLFILFSSKKDYEEAIRNNKLLETLFNYVLSPALLVYGVILLLYFLKIAVLWSLPKGGVAYIVVSFITAAFLLKGCRSFLSRQSFDWLYNHLSLIVAPALVMYWVGTWYRINQYGYTEARVYLVVTGLVLTATALLFLSQRWGRYLYVACLSVGLLSVVTYIPGITAKDIGIASQAARGNDLSKEGYKRRVWNMYDMGVVDIEGFRSLQQFGSIEKGPLRLKVGVDSLSISEGETTLYAESKVKFLQRQLLRAGLSLDCDSIPEAAYPLILRLEMDSAAVVFDHLIIERDTVCSLNYLSGGIYLKRY